MRDAQLPLQFSPAGTGTFENFVSVGNEEVFTLARQACRQGAPHLVMLWGSTGVGKSHLLDAVCQSSTESPGAVYIPLDTPGLRPQVLDGLEGFRQVVLDDLGEIGGQPEWDEAIFHLANRCAEQGSQLWIAGNAPPARLTSVLPDLSSRLAQGLVLHLVAPHNEQLEELLRQWGQVRGVSMSQEVINYLLSHAPRAPKRLFPLLERLSEATLIRQKRPSVPILKELLDA